MNPYYPVRPCPYRDPRRSPPALRFAVANHPADNLFHVATESKWLLTKGLPRQEWRLQLWTLNSAL